MNPHTENHPQSPLPCSSNASGTYLMIRNRGLAPVESFTILGLSTARGSDKIGQFGSGTKHGILTLLRHNIDCHIFIGEDELKFTTHDARISDKDYKEVRYSFQGEEHKTGMCLDFGSLDWDSPGMAVREFICNALDQGEPIKDAANPIERIEASLYETRVFIAMDKAIVEYWADIRSKFLQYDGLESETIIPAKSESPSLYRRGVFVRDIKKEETPIFSYNFQDGKIDECRNMSDSDMCSAATKMIVRSVPTLEKLLDSFRGPEKWEHGLGYYADYYVGEVKKNILAAWTNVFGSQPMVDNLELSVALSKRNIQHVCVPTYWVETILAAGVTHGRTLIKKAYLLGDELPATARAEETFRTAWAWLEKANLTSDQPFPKTACFSQPMKAGSETLGYYHEGTVFLNIDHDGNDQTALEELAHYITGAKDETRDFQDFAFKLATRLAKL